jgi:broad specificity phosphatase PhoE
MNLMGTLYLIRHGQASFGQADYDRLSEKGKTQGRMLANHLIDTHTRFDLSVTGTLTRHLETEEAFMAVLKERNIPLPESVRMANFNEYESEKVMAGYIPLMIAETPSFQDKVTRMFSSKGAFQEVFETIMRRWVKGEEHIPGLKSWREYQAGVTEGITTIMQAHGRGKKVAIFTSGGPIGAVVQMALGLSDQTAIAITWQVVNTSLSRFKCTHDTIMLSTFNEHVHLEMNGKENHITYR